MVTTIEHQETITRQQAEIIGDHLPICIDHDETVNPNFLINKGEVYAILYDGLVRISPKKTKKETIKELKAALKKIETRSAPLDKGVNKAGDKQISAIWELASEALN